jgi:lipid-A-disaccharide synthase
VQYLGPVFVQAALQLLQHKPNLQFVTPLPNQGLIEQFTAMLPQALQGRWHVVLGHSHPCLEASQAVLLASGTATLEAMMLRKPMVIAYKMPWLSYQYMRGKALSPYVGLPNVLLQRFAVPELIQDACTPKALCAAVLYQLDSDANRAVLERDFAAQHALLNQNSGALAAACMARYL